MSRNTVKDMILAKTRRIRELESRVEESKCPMVSAVSLRELNLLRGMVVKLRKVSHG